MGSGIFNRVKSYDLGEAVTLSCREAGIISLLIVGFALIREPVGFAALSLPGGAQGFIELFSAGSPGGFFPIRVISSSAGALIILGYGLSVYAYFRNPLIRGEDSE
jgi:hypothetical protein